MNETSFPPFVPAKPKGSVAAEIAQAKVVEGVVESVFKPKRRKKETVELVPGFVPTITTPEKKRKKRKPRAATVPIDTLVAFAGLTTEEIEQVVNVCEAINTFPKQARKRIAAAIGQLFS